jgi:hypothetical protein
MGAIKNNSEENIFDRIREIFGKIPENYNILEEQIDIDLQMEYFEQSRQVKQDLVHGEVMHKKELIFDETLPEDERKKLFAQLASLEDVEAFRTIEKYLKAPETRLKNWAILALQESRMLLESKLLDENRVFISTGLGGKGTRLRYFVAIIGKGKDTFTELHKKVIRNEFEICLKIYDSEVEKIDFMENYAMLLTIMPLQVSIRDVFKEAIQNCNEYGNFLKTNFIVTNVKELTVSEIKDFLKKQKQTERNSPTNNKEENQQ